MKNKKKLSILMVAVGIFVLLSGWTSAQEKFLIRPIQFVIPWAPGGGTINAQILQSHFEKAIGDSIQIINKPGGEGTIWWNYLANSPPDGYTGRIVNPTFLLTQYTTKSGVSFKRVDPILLTVEISSPLAVKSDDPWKNFKEFINYAKANPGKVQMRNLGMEANYHVSALGLEMVTGAKFTHVPFKGSGPLITAGLEGHVDALICEISTLLPYVEAKKFKKEFKILVNGSEERNFALPDVPAIKEEGYEQIFVGTWFAWVTPKGVPIDRFRQLHDVFKMTMETKEFKDYYKKFGGVVKYLEPREMLSYFEEQDRFLKKIIDFSGFKPNPSIPLRPLP